MSKWASLRTASVKGSHRGLGTENDLFHSHKGKQKSALDLSPHVTLIFGFLFNLIKYGHSLKH